MTERSASIDDLLGPGREVPERAAVVRRRRSWSGLLVRDALAAGGLTAVTVVGLAIGGIRVGVPSVLAGFLALLLVRRVAGRLAPSPPRRAALPRDPARDDGTYRWGTEDALGGSVHRWERRLAWSKGESDRFRNSVHPALAEFVDERLRLRHGVTRSSDPVRARALLGELVWTFLEAPPKRTPAPRDLMAFVAEVEKI